MGKDVLDELTDDLRERLGEWNRSGSVKPMLATLTHNVFSHKDWIFERKLDGERCIATVKGGRVTLWSRREERLNDVYPEIVDALKEGAAGDMVVDGEIVAFEGEATSFSKLRRRVETGNPDEVEVFLYLFDILSLDGKDLTALPLRRRKSILRKCVNWNDSIAFTNHRNENGEEFLAEACEKNWEGLIAKRADSPYLRTRSKKWLKFKCDNRQEFVIGGYTEPAGTRVGLGALLLGYYEGETLHYAGKVGTGFDTEELEELQARLERLQRKTSPFKEDVKESAHWVTPRLVTEVAFTEWTDDGKLRNPSYEGLRTDKLPSQVVKQVPMD